MDAQPGADVTPILGEHGLYGRDVLDAVVDVDAEDRVPHGRSFHCLCSDDTWYRRILPGGITGRSPDRVVKKRRFAFPYPRE
jgi:hypothetical protein